MKKLLAILSLVLLFGFSGTGFTSVAGGDKDVPIGGASIKYTYHQDEVTILRGGDKDVPIGGA